MLSPLLRTIGSARILLVPALVLIAISTLGSVFFVRGQSIMEEQLRNQLRTNAAIAALSIDARLVNAVHSAKDIAKPQYKELLSRLDAIKRHADNIHFVYVMRRTEDPNVLAFVADAEALLNEQELDENKNGTVDAEEAPSLPGDSYDVTDVPALRDEAFNQAAVDPEITVDQWGRFISGYAPIRDAQGNTVGVIGIDMSADEFYMLSQSVFSVFALLLVLLGAFVIAWYVGHVFRARRMESLQQLDDERTAFMDMASHQLGVPLATFRWWLEILREQDGGKFCKKNGVCDQMQHGIDRLDSIIHSLRRASRLHRGEFAYRARPVSLPGVLNLAIKQMKPEIRQRKQQIEVSIEEGIKPLPLDSELIGGVIEELVENASIYSPEKSTISVRLLHKAGGVRLEVQDHGCGIPAKDLPHIFEKFKRGSNASISKPVGNGLGLYIAKGIIERARGKMWVKSEEGKGTTFFVWLPNA